MRYFWKYITLCLLVTTIIDLKAQNLFQSDEGSVDFISDAPLELIQGSLNSMQGVLNVQSNTFAFKVEIEGFDGFNNPLQKVHFRENYLETKSFPSATFTGKIIEDVDLTKDGEFEIRAKGKFTLHGIEQERIIKGRIIHRDQQYIIECSFEIPLKDHDIRIPKIVYQKIAEVIRVQIKIELHP